MTNKIESIDTYNKMNLKSQLISNINVFGFHRPTPLQQRAITPILKGKDVIVQAQCDINTDITLCIPTLQFINVSERSTQAIIVSPTREGAFGIVRAIYGLSDDMDINLLGVIGGTSIYEDLQNLREGVNHIVVGTPSRICDLISRNALKTDAVKLVIVHQTDVLLMKGFKEHFLEIMHFAHENVQSVFHSRTLPVEVLEFTKKHMRESILISDKSGELSLEGVKQFYVAVPDEEPKLDTLCDIYETVSDTKTVVFCNTSKKADWLVDELDRRGFSVFTVSNTIDQNQCNRTMEKFLSSSRGVLITTDISTHGISLQQVPLVINYDIPFERKIYIRRVGREGGKNQKSVALNFVLVSDNNFMADIERFYSTRIEELTTSVADFI